MAMDRWCAECGYLTIHNRKTRELVEVETAIRGGGKIPAFADETRTGDQPVYEKPFLCFMREPQVTADLQDGTYPSFEKQRDAVFHKLRTCESWTAWKQGFTPKEHLEMNLLQEQRDWQRKCQDADQSWRESQDRRDRRWRVFE